MQYGLDVALSESSLEEALIEINKAAANRGMKIAIKPKKLFASEALAASMWDATRKEYDKSMLDTYDDLFKPLGNPHRKQVKRLSLDALCDLWKVRFGMEAITFAQTDDLYEAIAERLVCARRMKLVEAAPPAGAHNDYNALRCKAYQLKKERY